MDDVKITVKFTLPGRVLYKEEGPYETVKPSFKNAKCTIYKPVTSPDPNKYDKHILEVDDSRGNYDRITFFTRKTIPASQIIKISKQAYDYYVSNDAPSSYKVPPTFKISRKQFQEGVRPATVAWSRLSKEEKIAYHLRELCLSLGGQLESFEILND